MLEVLRAAERYLSERDVDAPRRSAELLMGRALGLSKLELYLAHDRPVSEHERARLRPWIAARGRHVPVAHLLGDWEFFGLELHVGPDVLIPRPETERLVELAAARAPAGGRCVDVGTGSGAIAVALAVQRPDLVLTATDVSAAAAAVAHRNVERHGASARIEIVVGRSWEPLRGRPPFDLLVSNPPYVDPAHPELVARDVATYEPAIALFTPPSDPAAVYRELVAGARTGVAAGGWLLFETGVLASEPALALLRATPFLEDVELEADLAGQPRYLTARLAP